MFLIVKTFTTVGYGSINATSNDEMLFIMVAEFSGIVLFGYMMGQWSYLIGGLKSQQEIDKEKVRYNK